MTHTSTARGRAAFTAARPRLRPLARGALGALAATVCLLALPPGALAGPPNHNRAEALDITGFDHACGTAVDTEGNVYVASAGDDEIVVFDADHQELTAIANANEPCGLAVDTNGALYTTERATGNVVRYVPDNYPFVGTPTYDPAETIDSSGEAAGIGVDPFDNRLYVAKGGRVDAYRADGNIGINEVQRIAIDATGGEYTLSFDGEETDPIPLAAPSAQVQTELEELSTIGAGNVSVVPDGGGHAVTFVGALASTQVPQMIPDDSNVVTDPGFGVVVLTLTQGFNGHIGEGELTDATGVAAYTYSAGTTTRYLYAADADSGELKVFSGPALNQLKLRRTIAGVDHDADPDTPDQPLGFGPEGTYLAVDPGNRSGDGCAKVGEQACTAGHVLIYNAAQDAVEEFEATGEFLDRIASEDLEDAEPTDLAVERSGGPNDGTIYVTSGAEADSELLAFEPLVTPSRQLRPELSQVLTDALAIAVDDHGNVYVAAGPRVHVYDPQGSELTVIEGQHDTIYSLAVDSAGNVYAVEQGALGGSDIQMTYYAPQGGTFPPQSDTEYTRHEPPLMPSQSGLAAVAVNPADQHAFVLTFSDILEFGAAAEGSPTEGGCDNVGSSGDIGVYGANGYVYATAQGALRSMGVIDCEADELVANLSGGRGCESGQIGTSPAIAVDQSNGHLLQFSSGNGGDNAREYDAAGSCVAEFGTFSEGGTGAPYGIAVDNGEFSPNQGTVYVAFDGSNNTIQPFDVTAFTPLSYGEVPVAAAGEASEIEAGSATLNGEVTPRGFALEECRFEYLSEADYEANLGASDPPFQGAISVDCAEGLGEIGIGQDPVSVHADVTGLDPSPQESRYRFRLIATNEFGEALDESLFGPPLLTDRPTLPILYEEATLRAELDPSGLATTYRFEYGTTDAYGQSTPEVTLPAGDGAVAIEAALTGLQDGADYHFRLIASNGAKEVLGEDRTFTTLQRPAAQECPNTPYRLGLSVNLPDCRAYELITPADMGGKVPNASDVGVAFSAYRADPRGPGAGESVGFNSSTLPGFEGTGDNDGYRSTRAAGEHPEEGWSTELQTYTFAQSDGGGGTTMKGVSSDQRYWLLDKTDTANPSPLTPGRYLRTPFGTATPDCNQNGASFQPEFELVGCGSLGIDPQAQSPFTSAGGEHVVFESGAHLEPEAAPAGTQAVYKRAAGEASAAVVSVPPGGGSFADGEDASYVGGSENGEALLFDVDGALYLRHANQTHSIATSPYSFAGVAEDGSRVLFIDAPLPGTEPFYPPPANLYACDPQAGPCTGPEPTGRTLISAGAIPVSASADASRVLFTSELDLTGAQENEAGQHALPGEPNLYAWDGTDTGFVAILHPQDLVGFGGSTNNHLRAWPNATQAGGGRATSPTRSTPDGDAFVFQSHAKLTAYENGGIGQIYRYAPGAPAGERLACVSCAPSGAPPTAIALLQHTGGSNGGVTGFKTRIANVTDDGRRVFFHSPDQLLPEDANGVVDVYQWKANGSGGCERPGGCLSLISTGQGEAPSHLFGMSADGHDVFFTTREKLVGQDNSDSVSIYDARVEGGIPDPPIPAPCSGDACQGQGIDPPPLPEPSSSATGGGGNVDETSPGPRCAKPARRARRHSSSAKRLRLRARRMRGAAKRSSNAKRSRASRRKAKRFAAAAKKRARAARRQANRAKRCRRARANANRRAGR